MRDTSLKVISFDRSFCTWHLKDQDSYGRFKLESTLDIIDLHAGHKETIYLCAGVLAAHVYGSGPLFKIPSYEYQIAFSQSHPQGQIENYRIFRTSRGSWDFKSSQPPEPYQDSIGPCEDLFRTIDIDIKEVTGTIITTTFGVIKAFEKPSPMVTRLTYTHPEQSTEIRLEFPIKHLNIQPNTQEFQVETGPMIIPISFLPSRVKAVKTLSQCIQAYTVFNQWNQVEFLLHIPPHQNNHESLPSGRRFFSTRSVLFPIKIEIIALPP